MKIDNIINKALSDVSEKGYTSARIIQTIKDNFGKYYDDYDFLNICIDCHMAFNESENYESESYEAAEKAVADIREQFNYHYHLDSNEFSYSSCDCCNSKLGGDRFFYIVYNSNR